jgi:hypothetical protein
MLPLPKGWVLVGSRHGRICGPVWLEVTGGGSAGRGRLWALVGVVGLVLPAVESPMLISFAKSSGVVFWNPTTAGCGWISDT